ATTDHHPALTAPTHPRATQTRRPPTGGTSAARDVSRGGTSAAEERSRRKAHDRCLPADRAVRLHNPPATTDHRPALTAPTHPEQHRRGGRSPGGTSAARDVSRGGTSRAEERS